MSAIFTEEEKSEGSCTSEKRIKLINHQKSNYDQIKNHFISTNLMKFKICPYS